MTTPALARPPRRTLVIGPTSARRLGQGIADLARYRELLLALSVFRVRVRYKQSVLGFGWAVLQPVALMVIYTLVFSLIASVPTGGQPYALFAYTALLPWTFFSGALTGATSSLVANTSYVTKVYFPREIVPITYVVAAFFDFLVASLVLGGMLAYYQVVPGLAALWALPIMVLAIALVTGLGLAAAALQVRVRDIGVAMPLLLQVWMFASPVVYPPEAVPSLAPAGLDAQPDGRDRGRVPPRRARRHGAAAGIAGDLGGRHGGGARRRLHGVPADAGHHGRCDLREATWEWTCGARTWPSGTGSGIGRRSG